MTDALALITGYCVMTLMVIALLSVAIHALAEFIGKEVFTRMRRIYHLTSIAYWLHHYEKRGRKCFLTPEEGVNE